MSDRKYLLTDQYRDASKLGARFQFHQQFSTNEYSWPRWAFDRLEQPSGSRLLELGCGPGALWAENRARIPDGWEVVLSDLSAGMIDEAQRALGDQAGRFHFTVVDIQALPFEEGCFDGVIANHMLYHVPDVAQALSEVRRVLNPGGRFYAATNGDRHLREMRELVRVFDPDITFGPQGYSFGLENGAAQLEEWFEDVELSRYEDSLLVTEAAPLVAYILSSVGNVDRLLEDDRTAELAAFLEHQLSKRAAIHISKDVGLFVALRGRGP
jgi:SAM-dependent methyltransferase